MSGLLCSVPLLSGLLAACAPAPPFATGYVEGEFLLIAPIATARVESLAVRRGQSVSAGEALVHMERSDATIALAEAEAALAQAKSKLADLQEGRREAEIAVIAASLASARAQAAEAANETDRVSQLVERGAAAQAQLDEVQTRLDVARARVAEVEADLEVARLPARAHVIAEAEAAVTQAEAARDAAAWQLEQRVLDAPADGTVFELLRRAGEIAGPAAPVLNFLPDGAVLLRVYVPERDRARIAPGDTLAVGCDGCPDGLTAKVTYVSDEAEFTPPVIYSVESRQKLVYLVEARPGEGADALRPGQIVEVQLGDAE